MSNNSPAENNSYYLTKNYLSEYEPIPKTAFAEFIREKRKEYNDETGKELSTKELGQMIGIDYENFRKILNRQKPTKKRDCIIAICFALHLTPGEINHALGLYNYMPALDENNPRENYIVHQYSIDTPITVDELNCRLLSSGFPALDIHDYRNGKKKSNSAKTENSLYKKLAIKVSTPIDFEHYYGDQYNSLCTIYDPSRCKITGEMLIFDIKKMKHTLLTASSDSYRNTKTVGKEMPKETDESIDSIIGKLYKSLEETGDYKSLFIELDNAINTEKRRHLEILNDSKNYQSRISAKLINDSITVFIEQYNYTIPELNEYYLLTRSAKQYRLYVYNRSSFMAWYLSDAKYKAFFGVDAPEPKEYYDSLEEIQELIDKTENNNERIRYVMRQNAFKRLKPEVDKLYQELKARVVFIQNLEYIFENPVEVLSYYKLETDYDVVLDDYGNICDYRSSKEYSLSDGTVITISIDDIYRAFEYGLPDIQEICRIKAKYGSIEAALS